MRYILRILLGIILLLYTQAYGQNPGGVASSTLWLKADAGITETSGTITNWADQSGAGEVSSLSAVGSPQFLTQFDEFNFNPTVDLVSGGNDYLTVSLPNNNTVISPSEGSIIAVFSGSADQVLTITSGAGACGGNRCNSGFRGSVGQFGNDGQTYGGSNISGQANIASIRAQGTFLESSLNADRASKNTASFNRTSASYELSVGSFPGFSYSGKVAEVIVYKTQIGATELQQVESYLALKYGITLDQSGAGATDGDYIASNGITRMWDESAAATNYNRDIFGIGKDDNQLLEQRISQSVNDDGYVLTVSTSSDMTSANNALSRTAITTNNTFLTFANNNGAFTENTLSAEAIPDTKARIDREWQIQKTTGFTQDVNLRFDNDNNNSNTNTFGYWTVFVDSDGDFTSGATRVGVLDLNGQTSISNTDIPTGSFVTIAPAVAPGGILGSALWLDAETESYSNASAVTIWSDQSGNSNDFNDLGATREPTFNQIGINFHPSITFDGNDGMNFNGYISGQGLDDYSVYSVNIVSSPPSSRSTLLELRSNTGAGRQHIYQNNLNTAVIERGVAPGGVNASFSTTIVNNEPHVTSFVRNSQQITLGVNSNLSTPLSDDLNITTINRAGIGLRPAQQSEGLTGVIAEMIIYNNASTTTERLQIESYLALKYGITLAGGTVDYKSSYETNFWEPDATYKHDIFGLGRDDNSGIHQKISTAVNDHSMIVSVEDNWIRSNEDALRSKTISLDTNFVMFAHNNGSKDWTTSELCLCKDHYRIGREWQVQLTGSSIDSVYVGVHKDSLSILSNNIDVYVLVDKDGDFSESPYQEYKMALSGDFYRVKIPIEDNDYLTFAHVRKTVRMRNGKYWLFGKQTNELKN